VKHVRSLRRADYFEGESGVVDEEQAEVLAAARRGRGWANSGTRACGAFSPSSSAASSAEKYDAPLKADHTVRAACEAVPYSAAEPTPYDPRVCMSSAAAQQVGAIALMKPRTGSAPVKRVSFPNIDAGQDGNGRHAAAGSTKQAEAVALQIQRAEAAVLTAKAEANAAAAAAVEAAKVEAEAAAAAEAAMLKARAWAQARDQWTPTGNGISSGVPFPGGMPPSSLSGSAHLAVPPPAPPGQLSGQLSSSFSEFLSQEYHAVRTTTGDLPKMAAPISVTDKATLRELKSKLREYENEFTKRHDRRPGNEDDWAEMWPSFCAYKEGAKHVRANGHASVA